jgi:hypothetical protein
MKPLPPVMRMVVGLGSGSEDMMVIVALGLDGRRYQDERRF